MTGLIGIKAEIIAELEESVLITDELVDVYHVMDYTDCNNVTASCTAILVRDTTTEVDSETESVSKAKIQQLKKWNPLIAELDGYYTHDSQKWVIKSVEDIVDVLWEIEVEAA